MANALNEGPAGKSDATLREQAYGSFTHHLLARDLRAGQFVSQRELTQLTGLPLGAIRELIPRLETEGLIRTVPKRGMQIAHVDLKLIRDAFQFRLFIEREAVAIFAVDAADEVIEGLRRDHAEILAEFHKAQAVGPLPAEMMARAQALDWQLHTTIVDFLANTILTAAYRVNTIKIRLIRQEKTRLNDTVAVPTMKEHLSVIDAIATRDPEVASRALSAHIENARRRALDQR